MKTDFVRINNRNNFVKPIKLFHPNDPRYIKYWREEKRKIIEGDWVWDNDHFRFVPPKLYFTVNHGTILLTDEQNKSRYVGRPDLNTIFWEFGYLSFESLGFSGFENSDVTCNHEVLTLQKNYDNIHHKKHINLFKSDGTFKEYCHPREFMRNRFSNNLGLPLYENTPQNVIVLGSRGSGKSYYTANSELAHELITSGVKRYNPDNKQTNKVTLLVGSGESSKSSELCTKVRDTFIAFGEEESLGVYGKFGEDDYTPSPFYLDMIGDLSANNKDNPYRHEYKVRINGREVIRGTGNSMHHVVYSEQKAGKKGGQAGAGGRYQISVIEEIGLSPLLREAFRSNEATIQTDGIVFGRQWLIGTSENIEAIQPAKEIFTAPKDYRMISFEDDYEHSGQIGFFLPATLTFKEALDEHGNVDLEKSLKIINKRREEKAKSNNPDLLRGEKLNYPLVPSELWLGTKAKLLPYEETAEREKELLSNQKYKSIGKCIKLRWDSKYNNGVTYEIDYDSKPIWEFPITNVEDVSGAIVVYDFPQYINGEIPDDMYIYTHDPYIAEAMDEGGSLGVTQVWLSPKYWSKYMVNSPLVACYMGKHKDGKVRYYEEQEKLIAMYGNCNQMFYYEADRGEDCYNYYLRKNKLYLLAPRPQGNDNMFSSTIRKFGFIVGSRLEKLNKLSSFHDFLLQDIDLGESKKIKVIETIPDIHLLREIMAYDVEKGNFDAVSASLGIVVAIQELEKRALLNFEEKDLNKIKNKLAFLSMNTSIFHGNENNRNKYR